MTIRKADRRFSRRSGRTRYTAADWRDAIAEKPPAQKRASTQSGLRIRLRRR